jgi:hypothetical protein
VRREVEAQPSRSSRPNRRTPSRISGTPVPP